VIEHCYNPNKLFKELYRILKKEGYLVFSMPCEGDWTKSKNILDQLNESHSWKPKAEDVYNHILKNKFNHVQFNVHNLDNLNDKQINWKPGQKKPRRTHIHAIVKKVP
jgi:SAM-dependent methyltransferase